jgi:hypothetical protein
MHVFILFEDQVKSELIIIVENIVRFYNENYTADFLNGHWSKL